MSPANSPAYEVAGASAIWTVGHSSRTTEVFLELLRGERIELLADVRRHAGSRMHPQFNPDRLAQALENAGIAYRAFPELGGRRRPRADSTNTYWRNASFRGYADYMETPAFEAGLARLMQSAGEARTAMMCAEALWWRCHRSLIADALKARGVPVVHIMDEAKTVEHRYTSAARVADGRLYYGPGPDLLDKRS